MKRLLLPLCSVALIALICFCSFSAPARAYKTDTSYTSDAISYFNSNYSTVLVGVDAVYPFSLKGENTNLNTLYPVIIGQQNKGYIFFGRNVTYDAQDGFLELTFYGAFSYVFSSSSVIDISDITVPDSLIEKISFTYTFENGAVRDQFGNASYFFYLPTSANIGSITGFNVYNNFAFPTVADYPVPEESSGIEYSQVLSADVSFEFSSYDAYSYDEDEFSNAIDIEGALSDLDDDIFEAKDGFHVLFDKLFSAFRIGPVVTLLLTVSLAFYILGRL